MSRTGQGSAIARSIQKIKPSVEKFFSHLKSAKNHQHIKNLFIKQKPINRIKLLLTLIGRPFYYFLLAFFVALANIVPFFVLLFRFTTKQFSSFAIVFLGFAEDVYIPNPKDFFPKRPKTSLPKLDRVNKIFQELSVWLHHPIYLRHSEFTGPAYRQVNLVAIKITRSANRGARNLAKRISSLPSLPKPKFPRITLPLIPILVTFFVTATLTAGFYFWIIKDLPSPHKLATLQPKQTTQIFDRHGELLYKIFEDEKRTLVNLDTIPTDLRNATIAIEDKNFYEHQGLSFTGIIRAIKRNLTTEEVQGGSTITQQLIKNTLLTSEKTLTRKVKEVILAIHTELIFDKDEILNMYFNEVGYGGPAYGVQEASQQYFGKNVSRLNLAESAFLAGLPQAPTRYSPFGAYPELAAARQHQVLDRMVEDEYITRDQATQALTTILTFTSPETSIKAPHFVMYVRDLLVSQFGEEMVTQGGLQVHTSLDLTLQETTQQSLNQELDSLAHLNVNNGAVIITEPQTGQILTMVGSRDYFDIANDGQVNLTISRRQPGSSIKPVNYALALEKGYTPASVINDAPITFIIPGSDPWTPKNYDGKYHGPVTLRTALASSYNIPAAKLLNANGITQMAQLAQNMGITTWDDPSRFGLALTLGSNEVKMTEMAEVYGTFANLGIHVPLTPLLSITDSRGNDIPFSACPLPQDSPGGITSTVQAATSPSCQPTQAISPQTAYLISDILSDNRARAPAFGFRSVLNIPGHQVAVKTGTSNDLKDNWTIGYTSDYLVATWVGNNDSTPMSRVASGITGASPIWAKTITHLLANSDIASFPTPQNIVKVPVCTLTGTLTCSACPNTRLETFTKGTQPTAYCTDKQIATILKKDKKQKDPLASSDGQLLPTADSTSR